MRPRQVPEVDLVHDLHGIVAALSPDGSVTVTVASVTAPAAGPTVTPPIRTTVLAALRLCPLDVTTAPTSPEGGATSTITGVATGSTRTTAAARVVVPPSAWWPR